MAFVAPLLASIGIGTATAADVGAAGAIGAEGAAGGLAAAEAAGAGIASGTAAAETGAVTAATAATGASTLAQLATYGQLAGGVLGAGGAVTSAMAARQSALYQGAVASNNQAIATQQANLAAAEGASKAEQSALRTRAMVGAERAGEAAGNIDVNTGSALDVRSSAAALGQLDALTIRADAARQAYGYQTAATGFGNEGSLARAQASQEPIAGTIGATTSLLSGATGAASQYARWQLAAGSGGNALF